MCGKWTDSEEGECFLPSSVNSTGWDKVISLVHCEFMVQAPEDLFLVMCDPSMNEL